MDLKAELHLGEGSQMGQVFLEVWHDKGCSVYSYESGGVWRPVDGQSDGAMVDLIGDLR